MGCPRRPQTNHQAQPARQHSPSHPQPHSNRGRVNTAEHDLHGLGVRAAQALVAEHVAFHRSRGSGVTRLRYITGRGNRSEGGIARLLPAVREQLDEMGVPHKDDGDGALVATVRHRLDDGVRADLLRIGGSRGVRKAANGGGGTW